MRARTVAPRDERVVMVVAECARRARGMREVR